MTPYKQAFVVTTENGAVTLAVVTARNSMDGKAAAKLAAEETEQCEAWDVCAFPTYPDLPEGVRRLFIR